MFASSNRTICGRTMRRRAAAFIHPVPVPGDRRCPFFAAAAEEIYPRNSSGYPWRSKGRRRMSLPTALSVDPLTRRAEREVGAEAQRLGYEIAQVLRSKGTRLVLHFDLNKTLVMVDPAGRKTQSQVLNSVLAEICWGRVDHQGCAEEGSIWTWDGSLGLADLTIRSRRLLTPLVTSYLLQRSPGGVNAHQGSFTEDGHPGSSLRAEYLKLEQALSLPQAVASSPLAEGAGLAGRESFYLLPSFLECLVALTQAEADYSVVFRTFGEDVAAVSREYNAFCEGAHPLFPGVKMDGSEGRGDYRVHLHHDESGSNDGRSSTVGSFYRDEKGLALVLGTLNNPKGREEVRTNEEDGYEVCRSINDIHDSICQRVAPSAPVARQFPSEHGARIDSPPTRGKAQSGNDGSVAVLSEVKGRGRCLALRDYYPFWRENLEAAEAGKLLLVDLSENPKVWPVMFDDNIGRLDSTCGAHIVDVRDVVTGQPVPFDVALRRHLVRAEPFLAIDKGIDGSSAAAAAPRGNFFLLEVMKRLLPPERTDSRDGGIGLGSSSAGPEP